MKQEINVFDFDGTLTWLDTSTLFVVHCFGVWGTIFRGIRLVPKFKDYFLGKIDRKEIKEAVMKHFFRGITIELYQEKAKGFFQTWGWNLKKQVVWELEEYRRQGNRIVIVSANFEPFMQMAKEVIPFDHLIATGVEVVGGKITGNLIGENCWGKEKLRRFLEYLGKREAYRVIAFGDSRGDRELLENADIARWI